MTNIKKSILSILFICLNHICVQAQTHNDYLNEWKEISGLEDKGLTKSALEKTELLFQKAGKESNSPQIIKAANYLMKFRNILDEKSESNNVFFLDSLIAKTKTPAKNILQNMQAELLTNYQENNMYKLLNRTALELEDNKDIETWSLEKFHRTIISIYTKSLADKSVLQNTSTKDYASILIQGKNTEGLRPTLFDLLAQRALLYYENSRNNITRPADHFLIQDEIYFSPAEKFVNLSIQTQDSLSPYLQALLVYQDLIKFHLHDKSANALADVDLQRLAFVYRHAVIDNKFEVYEKALLQYAENFKQHEVSAEANYLLAELYHNLGRQYNKADTGHQFALVKAIEFATKAVANFPKSTGGIKAVNLIHSIKEPAFHINSEKVLIPNRVFKSLVSYKNLKSLHFKIIKVSRGQLKTWNETQWKNRDDFWKMLNVQPALKRWSVNLPQTNDHQEHHVEIKTDALDEGVYLMLASMNEKFDTDNNVMNIHTLYVSSLSFIENNNNEIFVLNRITGQPLAGATIQLWNRTYDYSERKNKETAAGKYTADKNGYAKFKIGKQRYDQRIQINYQNDELFTDDYSYNYYNNYTEKAANRVFFFLDRSIYRPGQTVYFKGIVIHQDSTRRKSNVVADHPANIELHDANGQLVKSIRLKSNEFGSFEGSFLIPEGLMNGGFYLQESSTRSNAYFSVEEYKRPKFFVELHQPTGTYKVNDSITVTGNATAYAGNVIDKATIVYRVVRKVRYPVWWGWGRSFWPPHGSNEEMEIANGIVYSNEKGEFSIPFKAIPDETVDKKNQPSFYYDVSVDVTDMSGETRSGVTTVAVSYQAIQLEILAPERIPVDSFKTIQVKSTNINNVFEKTEVKFEVFRLEAPNKIFRKRYWEIPDQFIMTKAEHDASFPLDAYTNEDQMATWKTGEKVYDFSDSTNANAEFKIPAKKLQPGWYKIMVSSRDKYGEPVRAEKYIEILNSTGTGMHSPITLVSNRQVLQPGEELNYSIHTGFDKIWLVNGITRTDEINKYTVPTILQTKAYSNKIDLTENDRGGVIIHYAFVKDNRMYKGVTYFTVPWSNKELNITYETFRDKLLPGATEEWKLKISGLQKDKIAAELLISMYDASLDQFKMHQWNDFKSIWPVLYPKNDWHADNISSERSEFENFLSTAYVSVPEKVYEQLENFGLYFSRRQYMSLQNKRDATVTVSGRAPGIAVEEDSRGQLEIADSVAFNMDTDKEEVSNSTGSQDVRTNFNETAFFFPQLKTDAEGNVAFSFTIPEALTTWKLMALAHTEELASAYSEKTVITQKPLMVQPNPPRFLREGDQMEFSAKLVNITDEEIMGTVQLELFDAGTNKLVNGWFNNVFDNQYFTVLAGQSVVVKFPINIPHSFGSALMYRIKAVSKNGTYTDGESSVLPVLTNRMLVTESLPLNMRSVDEKLFSFDKLLNSSSSGSLTHHALTVEYSSNPAWYAVQALPYMMEYPYDCAEQTFNRYYANALAAHITQSSPKIKAVFERWKLSDSAALLSNLQKNEELKSALLQETPWVLQAKDEEQQKRNIALLFELSKLAEEQSKNLNKLKEMQSSNGGFTWFKGGPDDRFITQYIVSGIGHLKKLAVLDEDNYGSLKPILDKAIGYLDNRIREDYDNLIKNKANLKNNQLTAYATQYLYMRSFFSDYKIASKNKIAYDYYFDQTKKFWLDQGKYLQAMSALALHRNDASQAAKAIVRSLKENAIQHEEMGMYWKEFTQSRYFWHEAPIESQAMMIEAFSEIENDKIAVDAMKTWLLKQKQTQNWHSTKATAEACYALLLGGSNWLAEEKTVSIQLGNTLIRSTDKNTEAGTGYFKETLLGDQVEAGMGHIKVSVQTQDPEANSTSWGAVYWQYFEDMDKITMAKTPLHLEKKLFVQKNSSTGPVLQALADGNKLQIGDRVLVRIVLRVDRDMEYVHMKDMRASGMEPVNVISSYKWQGGLGYYESTKDASTQFFFSRLNKGTYTFEYPVFVTHSGNFSNGITSIQCMYAPEFTSHSEGIRLVVE